MSIGPPLVEDGVIIPQKVVRSGDILQRDEMEKIIGEGLVDTLAPNHLIFHKKSNARVIVFRLRHIMMPFLWNGITVPVFGCIFFDNETKKCEIFKKSFRPRQCRVFPLNKVYLAQKLGRNITITPTCGSERLRGVLTVEQTKQVEEYLQQWKKAREQLKKVFAVDSVSSWKKLMTTLQFPAGIPVSDSVLQVLAIPTMCEHASEGWALVDWRSDLGEITAKTLSSVYGKERLNPRIKNEQAGFARHIKEKMAQNYKWWCDIRLRKGQIREIYETMVEVFHGRYMTNITLQHIRRNTQLYDYLLNLRS